MTGQELRQPSYVGHIRNVDHLAFRKAMLAQDVSVLEGLHILSCGARSRCAKLCTYLQWFAQPDKINTEPDHELPLPVTKLNSIFGWVLIPCQFSRAGLRCLTCRDICAGAHVAPSATSAIVSLIALLFRADRQQHAQIFQDSHDAMRSLTWHKDQKSVCALVLAIVNEAQTA